MSAIAVACSISAATITERRADQKCGTAQETKGWRRARPWVMKARTPSADGRKRMRRAVGLCLALIAGLAAGPAAAQDEIAREIQRKARAKERDEGFCQRAAERLER